MTNYEARDDEREALAGLLRTLGFRENDPIEYFYHRADAILAAGYRKHPEPEITDARLREAADRMSPLSKKLYTSLDLALVRDAAYRASERREPEITEARVDAADIAYTRAMRRDPRPWFAMRAALEAALLVPVSDSVSGEGEQGD